MGTNYYVQPKPACPTCKRSHGVLHIGKSSAGWKFLLRIDPDNGISTLDDWVKIWSQEGAVIRNEYGEDTPPQDMLKTITQRGGVLLSYRYPPGSHTAPPDATYGYVKGDFS